METAQIDGFRRSLLELADAHLVDRGGSPVPSGNRMPDGQMEMQIGDRRLLLVVKVRSDVYPRDAREIAWQFRELLGSGKRASREQVPVVLANAISESARQYFQEQDIAYHDLSGSLHLRGGGVYLLIDRTEEAKMRKRGIRLFDGRSATVLHTLFDRVGEWVTVTKVAEASGVSTAVVSRVFREMEQRNWLDVKGRRPYRERRLSKPDEVLDIWRERMRNGPRTRSDAYWVSGEVKEKFALKLQAAADSAGVSLEFTGQLAANAYAPHLTALLFLSVRFRERGVHDALLRDMGVKKVTKSFPNLQVLNADRANDLTCKGERVMGLSLASPLQAYLDLSREPGRSKEMAAHLRSVKLEWEK